MAKFIKFQKKKRKKEKNPNKFHLEKAASLHTIWNPRDNSRKKIHRLLTRLRINSIRSGVENEKTGEKNRDEGGRDKGGGENEQKGEKGRKRVKTVVDLNYSSNRSTACKAEASRRELPRKRKGFYFFLVGFRFPLARSGSIWVPLWSILRGGSACGEKRLKTLPNGERERA